MMDSYIMLRLKLGAPEIFVRGRRLSRHSQFGNLHAVPLGAALALLEQGDAKPLASHGVSIAALRERVAAAAQA